MGLVKKLLTPWTMIVAASHASVCRIQGPLRQRIDDHHASGEDLTQAVFHEYITTQKMLLKYRIDRTIAEFNSVKTGGVALATIGYKDVIKFARFLTRLLAIFIAFTMIGRNSVYPLISAGSPYTQQLEVMNPNQRHHIGLRI